MIFIGAIIVYTIMLVGITFLKLFLGINIFNIYTIFIIPIGGIILGLFADVLFRIGFKFSNKILRGIHIILFLSIPLLLYLGMNYIEYNTRYINIELKSVDVVKDVVKDIVKTNTDEFYGEDNFYKYLKDEIENSEIVLRLLINKLETVERPIYKYMFVIGSIFTVFFIMLVSILKVKYKVYCESCKRYYKEKILAKCIEDEQSKIDVEDLELKLRYKSTEIIKTIENLRFFNPAKNKIRGSKYIISMYHCKKCKGGEIRIRFLDKKYKSKTYEKRFKISRKFIMHILTKIKN